MSCDADVARPGDGSRAAAPFLLEFSFSLPTAARGVGVRVRAAGHTPLAERKRLPVA